MPAWKSLLSVLALAGTAVSCAHHDDAEVVPEHEREELLKKWDQEVCSDHAMTSSFSPLPLDLDRPSMLSVAPLTLCWRNSGPFPESPASPTSTP